MMSAPVVSCCRRLLVTLLLALLAGCVTQETTPFNKRDQAKAVEAYIALSIAYLRDGNAQMAKESLQKAKALDPDNPALFSATAYLFQWQGEPQLAEQNYRKALSRDPQFSEVRNNYGVFLYSQGRYDEAISELLKVAEDPLYAQRHQAYENLGYCALKKNDSALAIHYFSKALKINENQPNALLEMADLMLQAGNLSAANAHMGRFRDLLKMRQAEASARSYWIELQLARAQGNHDLEASNALKLKGLFPDSEEYRSYLKQGGRIP